MKAPSRFAAAALAACGLATGAATAQPFATPPPSDLEKRLTESSTFVKRVRVEGAASLPAADVAEAVRPFENRRLSEADIRALQQRLTRLYVDRGFVSSGVVLADDWLRGDELVLRAVEGRLTQVRFGSLPRWSRPQYLTRLLVPDDAEPLQLAVMQERLAWLRDAGIVERISAEVVPLQRMGESELVVEVEESRPWAVRVDYDNFHSPTIGARRASLNLSHRNVTGWGDTFDARYGDTEGLNDISVAYTLPVPRTFFRVGLRWDRSDSLAVSPAQFRALDIKALSTTAGGEIAYSLVRRASAELAVFAAHEKRRSSTTLLGIPFSFIPGIDDGVSRVTVTRAGLTFSGRGDESVIYARVRGSAGRADIAADSPAFGAPARDFRSWFAQAQYARRLPWRRLQLTARVEGQYTPDVLMPLERYALGGAATVRGYRENLILRDRAALGSVELQAALSPADWQWRFSAALFTDAAWSRNTVDIGDSLPRRIASVGVGLSVAGPWGLSARVYVARPAQRWLTPRDDLQDRGVHYLLSWEPTRLLP